jgi:hypothetical protein
MLRQENLGWQSICNGVGQMAGIFLGTFFLYFLFNFLIKLKIFFKEIKFLLLLNRSNFVINI